MSDKKFTVEIGVGLTGAAGFDQAAQGLNKVTEATKQTGAATQQAMQQVQALETATLKYSQADIDAIEKQTAAVKAAQESRRQEMARTEAAAKAAKAASAPTDDGGFLPPDWRRAGLMSDLQNTGAAHHAANQLQVPGWLGQKRDDFYGAAKAPAEDISAGLAALHKTGAEVAALNAESSVLISTLAKVASSIGGITLASTGLSAVWSHWTENNPKLLTSFDNTKTALKGIVSDVFDSVVGRGEWLQNLFDKITVALGYETEAMKKVHQGLEGYVPVAEKVATTTDRIAKAMHAVQVEATASAQAVAGLYDLRKEMLNSEVKDAEREYEETIQGLGIGGSSGGAAGPSVARPGGAAAGPSANHAAPASGSAPSGGLPGGSTGSAGGAVATPTVQVQDAAIQAAQKAQDKLLEVKRKAAQKERDLEIQKERDAIAAEERLLARTTAIFEAQKDRVDKLNKYAQAKEAARLAKMAKDEAEAAYRDTEFQKVISTESGGAISIGTGVFDPKAAAAKAAADAKYAAAQKAQRDAASAVPNGMVHLNVEEEAAQRDKLKQEHDAAIEKLEQNRAKLNDKEDVKRARDEEARKQAAHEDKLSGAAARRQADARAERDQQAKDDLDAAEREVRYVHQQNKKEHGIDSSEAQESYRILEQMRRNKATIDQPTTNEKQAAEREQKRAEAERYETARRKKNDDIAATEKERQKKILDEEQLRKDRIAYEAQRHKDSILDPGHLAQLDADFAAKHPNKDGAGAGKEALAGPTAGSHDAVVSRLDKIELNTRPAKEGGKADGADEHTDAQSKAGDDASAAKAQSNARNAKAGLHAGEDASQGIHSTRVGGNDGLVTGHHGGGGSKGSNWSGDIWEGPSERDKHGVHSAVGSSGAHYLDATKPEDHVVHDKDGNDSMALSGRNSQALRPSGGLRGDQGARQQVDAVHDLAVRTLSTVAKAADDLAKGGASIGEAGREIMRTQRSQVGLTKFTIGMAEEMKKQRMEQLLNKFKNPNDM